MKKKDSPVKTSDTKGKLSALEELQTQLLTRAEVGKLFKVKPEAVYMWERSDPTWIKPLKKGKYVGYRVEDVEAYLAGLAGKYSIPENKQK